MRIHINGNILLGAVVLAGCAVCAYYGKKQDDKKKQQMKDEAEKLEIHKKTTLGDRNINEELYSYSVGNNAIFSSEDRALVFRVLETLKRDMDKAKSIEEFDHAFKEYEFAIDKINCKDPDMLNAYIYICKESMLERSEKEKSNLERIEKQADRKAMQDRADTIADAIKTLKDVYSSMGIDFRFN